MSKAQNEKTTTTTPATSTTKKPELFMLMGAYIKMQLKKDPTYFSTMTKDEKIKDVLSHLHPESKFKTKDPVSCIKWYEGDLRRQAKKSA